MPNNKVRIIAEPQAIISLRRNPVFCNSKTLQHIFRNCAEIVLIADEEKFKDHWSNLESPIRRFFDAYDMPKPKAITGLKSVYEYPARCGNLDPFAIWLLNKPQAAISKFHDYLGLMAINPQSLKDDMFNLDHGKEYSSGDIVYGKGSGWANFIGLMGRPLPPFNELALNDRYIVANIADDGYFYGIQNLYDLFMSILPLTLKVPLKITIFCYHPPTSFEHIDNAIQELRAKIQEQREYSITIDVIYGDAHHKRFLYTNYFTLCTDSGYNAFRRNNHRQISKDNKLSIKSYLNNPFSTGDSEFDMARKLLDVIRERCEDSYYSPCIDDNNEKIRRVDLQNADIFQNRLLKIDIGADGSHN